MHRALVALVVLLTLAAPGVVAQEKPVVFPPPGAHLAQAGNATLAYWVGTGPASVDENVTANGSYALWFGLNATNASTPRTAYLNVTGGEGTLNATPLVLTTGAGGLAYASLNVTIPDGFANASVAYAFTGELYEAANNTTVLLGPVTGSGSFGVQGSVPAPAPAIPVWGYYAGGAVLLLAAVALGVSARNRNVRRRMNEAPRRSQVMREMELERELERAKEPEKAAEIKAEIRQQEQVREKRREIQILEAKRADVLKTMDLLRKRHEAGGLTKLQYDQMLAKRKADLERIEAEIAAMEAEGGSGTAAA